MIPAIIFQDGGDDEGIVGAAFNSLSLANEIHRVNLLGELIRLHLQDF